MLSMRHLVKGQRQEAGANLRDRAKGSLWGLIVGDCLGSPIQFSGKDSHPWIADMVACPVFGLPPGYWTDDGAKMREIAAELALAKMGYDDGRMWYTDECRDMTLEVMRISGLNALCLDLPKEGHGSANFFFRGPFWDLHYWDESSRRRFVDVVHKMWIEK